VSAKSFEFGVCSTQRICTQEYLGEDKAIEQLQPEAAAQIHAKDQLEESSQDHSPGPPQEDTQQSATKMKNNHHQLEGPLTQDCQPIPSGGHLPSSVIQVYVKGETTSVLSLCLPATATEVQERTADLLRVPAELLHITHEGHSLTDKAASRLRPGSNLHCTIKGKGGMEQPEMNNSPGTGGAEEARKQKAFILKEKGNEEYKAAKYEEAVCFYSLSISVIPDAVTINNRAQASLTRKAKALVGKIDYRQALQNLSMVLLADPSNQDALRLIADVKEEVEKEEKKGQTDIEEKLESSADQKHQDEAASGEADTRAGLATALEEPAITMTDDFGSGIASATVPRDKAGEFNRCRFVLENKFMPTREVDNSGAVSIEDDTETSDSSAAGLPLCVSSEDASDITLDGQDAAASDRVNSSKNALASDVIFGATGDTTNCKAESSDTVLDSQKPVEPRPFKYPKWKYEK
ncbi:hypothetical protein BaRGS_00003114, partial [Batillaria attramentaria]